MNSSIPVGAGRMNSLQQLHEVRLRGLQPFVRPRSGGTAWVSPLPGLPGTRSRRGEVGVEPSPGGRCTAAAAGQPVACPASSATLQVVVREGGLRVVVAANLFALRAPS